ncbi:sodium/solute symporter family protein [Citrifermentans bemidjiense Bem]|uniref:Sodium/solute symporter family protein n=1 Tax=Citrifermentans bemidjiense (strain ATCC BAA-1014 / DSM 16622 / JCM 12645 / Bem) TaxID=404380 RepID=B5EIS8_CITBB|nr:cation acetate symporter [Citrifermentans bemidjiense]ACH38443.1 sodium/solute symporter family protein [Citrifermentans bemidjiense Bem]
MRYLFLPLLMVLIFGTSALAADVSAQAAPGGPNAVAAAAAKAPPGLAASPQAPAAAAAKAQAPAPAPGGKKMQTNRTFTISMFLLIIAATAGIVVWASKSTTTASDYYAAGGGISGIQNGWAIAGDFLSAATFLGITGLMSLFGPDGFMYSVGIIISFLTILLIIAEPCRNAGKYTLGDILAFRSSSRVVRAVAALSAVVVSIFYLLGQMVGAGKLMQLLLGIPYKVSIIGVGALIIVYVALGGMKATTWVQIIKAALLMFTGVVLSVGILWKSGFSLFAFFDSVATSPQIQDHVRGVMKHPVAQPGFDYGQRFLELGLFFKNPLDQVSLGLAWILGAAGLPHVMMRFFTVPNAKEARKSVVASMFLIGLFLIMVSFLGFGAALYVTPQKIMALDKGGNMAGLMIAQYIGGGAGTVTGDLLLAFVCAVAFATILAVVSGLVLASSAAIAHDLYVNVIKKGKADQGTQIKVARVASFFVGAIAIVLGIACENLNIAQLVGLALAVVASANFPVLIFALFWKRFNSAGIIAGLVVGTVVTIGILMVSPNMTYPKKVAADAQKVVLALEKKQSEAGGLSAVELKTLEKAKSDYVLNKEGTSLVGLDAPLFPLKNPGILSVPIGFFVTIAATFLFRNRREEEMFEELFVRQTTGYGMAKAAKH